MTTMPAQGRRTSTPKKASIFKELYPQPSSEKDISFINRSSFNIGLVQQPDKIVARFALTIYPYRIAASFGCIPIGLNVYFLKERTQS
jgi:hypothetical protein